MRHYAAALTVASSSTPAPTSSPLLVQVTGVSANPPWLVPLLTGAFVLAAALIALLSLYLSDHRKLAREDRRQWDKEIRETYLRISADVDLLRLILSNSFDRAPNIDRFDEPGVEEARDRVFRSCRELELIAPKLVVEAGLAVSDSLDELLLALDRPDNEQSYNVHLARSKRAKLDSQMNALRRQVQLALRIYRGETSPARVAPR